MIQVNKVISLKKVDIKIHTNQYHLMAALKLMSVITYCHFFLSSYA